MERVRLWRSGRKRLLGEVLLSDRGLLLDIEDEAERGGSKRFSVKRAKSRGRGVASVMGNGRNVAMSR